MPLALHGFAWGLAASMALCFILNLYWSRYGGWDSSPYSTPFFSQYFPDFLRFVPRFVYFHTLAFFSFPSDEPFMYPAPTAVAYKLAYMVPHHPLGTFLLFGIVAATLGGLIFGRALVRRGIAGGEAYGFPLVTLLCSYPFWFAGKQANMEILVWVVVAAGLGFFLARKGYPAAVCFGIAASMKLYPLVYLGLLLGRRQYRQMVVGGCAFAAATAGSLWMVYPDVRVAWRESNAGLDQFRWLYMLDKRPEVGADHSLFALMKRMLHPYPSLETMSHLLTMYLTIAAVAGLVVLFLRVRKLPELNQMLCLTIASILLPPVSFEYTLLHLYVPFALVVVLVVEYWQAGGRVPGQNFLLSCFAVEFAFLPDLIHHGSQFGGAVKASVLLALCWFSAWQPLPNAAAALRAGEGSAGGAETHGLSPS